MATFDPDSTFGDDDSGVYLTGQLLVAMPGIAKPVKNFPPGIESKMIQNNFQWAADNRIRVLDEWRKRYDGKSEPKK